MAAVVLGYEELENVCLKYLREKATSGDYVFFLRILMNAIDSNIKVILIAPINN